jgi:ATP-binding cassette subfamily F protein 3
MRSKGVMQQALQNFEGSYVIVSHDRDFLDPIVNKVVEFSKGHIKTYLGNVSEYIYTKQREQTQPTASPLPQNKHTEATPIQHSDKERKRIEAEQRNKRYKATKPIQDKIDKLEKQIAAKEKQKTDIEELMGHPDFYKDGEKVKEVTAQYKSFESELNDLYFTWGELTKDLEHVSAEFNNE